MSQVPQTSNADEEVIASFGDEWSRFDQTAMSDEELQRTFDGYFGIFPWDTLPENAEGFDMGCGSGRWAKLVAPRVGKLNLVDASRDALAVARRSLGQQKNVQFIEARVDTAPLEKASQDFGYSLGVLHHLPDTAAAIKSCAHYLKPGAPFLAYLYYRFDNRPWWFRGIWQASELLRGVISRLPGSLKAVVTDLIAFTVYWPLARLALLVEKAGLDPNGLPLSFYRNKSFYMMRTDSRDRFGTSLEQRFTRAEIARMMADAGFERIRFSEQEPYWVAMGYKTQ